MATRAQCESALRIYEEALLAFKNVVRVGTAPLSDGWAAEDPQGAFAVAVYVSEKIDLDLLDDEDIVPAYLQVRDATGLYKVPTRVIEVERS